MAPMEAVDRQFRPTWDFYLAWAVLTVPALLFWPDFVAKGLPWYSNLAYLVVLPFLGTFFVYGPVMFLRQIARSGARGQVVLRALVLVVSGCAWVVGLMYVFDVTPGQFTGAGALAFGAIMALHALIPPSQN